MEGFNKKLQAFLFVLLIFAITFQFRTLNKWIRHSDEYLKLYKFKEAKEGSPAVALSVMRPMASHDQLYDEEATIVITHPPPTDGIIEPCVCDLVSIDCLDSIRCLSQDTRTQQYAAALGVMTREWIKENATLSNYLVDNYAVDPIGKGVQYSTVRAWENWIKFNELPKISGHHHAMTFVNESSYPFCKEHDLRGKRCFFGDSNAKEDLDDFEWEALGNFSQRISNTTKRNIQNDVVQFRKRALIEQGQPPVAGDRNKRKGRVPALGYLLSFAHMTRIGFNRQPPIRDAYKKHIERVVAMAPPTDRVLRVSLHIRRSDSCGDAGKGHAMDGYQKKASELDSIAQTTDKRMCYDTGVYMDALLKVQELAKGKPRLDIYLATDHAGSVMDEIRTGYPNAYKDWNWNFLNYSRDIFQYVGEIEGPKNSRENQDIQGESAMADLWHLSHGQVFVGHLGSRFGKVSWLLSMARRNAFVPFYTVDGHSFCCEIDEACGKMKPYILSMTNCMTFMHAFLKKTKAEKEAYWVTGSIARKRTVLQQKE